MTDAGNGRSARIRRYQPWVATVIFLLLASMLLGVLFLVAAPFVYPKLPAIETYVAATARLDGHLATVDGTTNLPDGALISYSLSVPDSEVDAFVSGEAPVEAGAFSFEADIATLPDGPTSVHLTFLLNYEGVQQPIGVILTYGPNGERLAGDQVFGDSGEYYLSETLPLPGT